MVKKRGKLTYEVPVTKVEQSALVGGTAGRQLRRRIEKSGRPTYDIESQALVGQAIGFLAEERELSIYEARDVLIDDAAARGLTLREAAERILSRED